MSVRTLVKSIQDIMRQDVGVDGDAQRISQLCWMFFLKIIDDQDQELELLNAEYRSPIPKKYQWRTWAADPEGITGDELLAFVNDELFPALKNVSTSTKSSDRRRVVKGVFEDAYNYMKSGQLMRQVVNKINDIDFNNLTERQHFGDIYEQILNDLQSAGNAGEYYTPRAVTAFMADRIDPHPGEILLDPACGTGGFLTCAIDHMRKRYVKRPEDEEKMQAALRAVEKKQLPHMLCVTNMLLHGIEDPSFVRHDNTLARPYISYTQSDRVDIVLTNPPFGGREEDGIESNFPTHFRTRETADLFLALIIRLLKPGGRAAVVLPDGTLFGEGVKTRLKEHLNALLALTARPDQIKQLRQTILTLAVRGKLVPQDPKDEPASELLKRIEKKRSQMLMSGYPNPDEARTQLKKLAEQNVPEGLDVPPGGWSWATLLQCSTLVVDCKNKTAPYAISGIRLIRTTNVRDGRMNLTDQKYVDQKTYEIWSARCRPEPGDILITREAPMGEVCLIPPGEQVCLGQRMMLARLAPNTIDPDFMIYSLRDPKLMDRVQDKPIGATVQHLRVGGVETLLVLVPPLAEQNRIVARVTESVRESHP
jgi:type I restriction enzyme M protein